MSSAVAEQIDFDCVIPTQDQIENCAGMKWIYLGDGLFEGYGQLGWFTEDGFKRE